MRRVSYTLRMRIDNHVTPRDTIAFAYLVLDLCNRTLQR